MYDSKNGALAVLAVSILVGILITAGLIYVLTYFVAYQSTSPGSGMVALNWAGYAVASDLQNPQPEVTSRKRFMDCAISI